MTQPTEFDFATANRALRLLRRAHDRWLQDLAVFDGSRFEDGLTREEAGFLLHGGAVEVLVWVRGLSDWCKNMPGYDAGHMAGKLAGARYAVNRSIHQLLDFAQVAGAMRFPLRLGQSGLFNTFAEIRWVGEQALPPEGSERRNQIPLRKEYLEHLAGQSIADTLKSLRAWFEAQVPAAGTR
ncbi:hypothetical protein [Amycolatopsis circi]|uniref:hypothetical protein n=1 Tax=Amycolatopsis circi TaxID=871959 RepID=UPI000E27E6A4|nr:hypothetical protein [Amycolatopsis circi]